jgi:hypothetical protein
MREGRLISELIRTAIEDIGAAITPPALWADLHRWKAQVPQFREDYDSAIRECYRVRDEVLPDKGLTGRPEDFGPELQLVFLQEMMANGGNAVQACYDVGVSKGTVFSRLSRKSPRYDPDFALHFAVAEAERGGLLYEQVWKQGMKEDDNAKKTLEIEGLVRHQHEILPAAVTRQLASTSRALLPEPGHGEPALEAEYVEVEG